MNKLKSLALCLIFQTILLAFIACDKDDGPSVNPNITQLTDMVGNQFGADWNHSGVIGISYPVSLFDPQQAPYEDHEQTAQFCNGVILEKFGNDSSFLTFISASQNKSVVLLVNSHSNTQSIGSLNVWDYEACSIDELRSSSSNISSAHFINEDEIIYYTFGNELHSRAGYYWMKDTPENDSLIFPYLSDLGKYEVVNGFDVHPGGTKLILPLVGWDQTPLIAEYDMRSGQLDILNINLNVSNRRFNLWLRYNHTGDNLLYGLYPPGVYINAAGDISEIGIVDLEILNPIILNTDINPFGESFCVFPNWNNDGTSITYGGGRWASPGYIGVYSLYIHEDVKTP